MVDRGGRYLYGETDQFRDTLAELEGLKFELRDPLRRIERAAASGCAGLHRSRPPFVTADPGYEAGERAAEFIGAKVIRVPLTKSYAHDVKAMAAASPNAGLIYICNPNNPTGTVTPRRDIEWLVENKPKGAIVMIDEAYIHLCTRAHVLRSGRQRQGCRHPAHLLEDLRHGRHPRRRRVRTPRPAREARHAHLRRACPSPRWPPPPPACSAKNLVPERRKIIGDIRDDVFAWMDKHNFKYVPSVSNYFMVDVRRPGMQVVDAMRQDKVYIGRVWPSWPTHVRVTVGTQDEMEKFKAAFLKVMA